MIDSINQAVLTTYFNQKVHEVKTFEFASGSVVGRDHRLPGRNGQDAFLILENEAAAVLIVADGCSGNPSEKMDSEVGAKLMVRLAASLILAWRLAGREWEDIRLELLRRLQLIIDQFDEPRSRFVNKHLLFTLVGVFIGPEKTEFFSLGDGIFYVNGERIRLGPFPNNQPPYLAYGLVETSLDPELLKFQIHRELSTSELQHCAIGTDGLEDLEVAEGKPLPGNSSKLVEPVVGMWNDDRYYRNPDMLRRTLFLVNGGVQHSAHGLLPDDTTLILGRRR